MATTYTVESVGRSSSVLIVTWGALAQGETGDPISVGYLTDATVQIYGTFTTASIAIEGSNDTTSGTAQWDTLSEPDGTLISGITSRDIAQILESPHKYRPSVTGGNGSTVLVVKLKLVSNGDIALNPSIIKVL